MGSLVILAVAIITIPGRLAGDLRDLDLGHWANPILERFSALGYVHLPATKPYPRDRIRYQLLKFTEQITREGISLSPGDSLSLEMLCQELGLTFRLRRLVEGEMLVWGDEQLYVSGDVRFLPQAVFRRGAEPEYRLRSDVDLAGGSGGVFIFDQRLSFEAERQRQKVERISGSQMTWRGGKYSVPWAYLRLRLLDPYPEMERRPLVELSAGRLTHWWGRGRQGTLLLSDNAPSFDALELRLNYKRVEFQSFVGILSTDQQRFLSGHRAAFQLLPGLSLGASEVVLYQAANIDPVYVNPLLPFYGNQWNQRDDDNILWSADLAWQTSRGLDLYGELLMDDVQYEQNPPAPQKLGFLLGGHWADPLGLGDTDLKWEWAGNQKWVYTQRRYANRYVGSDTLSSLGHWMGTDADAFGAFVEHRFHPRFNLGLGYSWTRKGEGRIERGFHYSGERYAGDRVAPSDTVNGSYVGDDPHTAFLSGTVERRDLGHLYFGWQCQHWLRLHARAWAGSLKNSGHRPGPRSRDLGGELKLVIDY